MLLSEGSIDLGLTSCDNLNEGEYKWAIEKHTKSLFVPGGGLKEKQHESPWARSGRFQDKRISFNISMYNAIEGHGVMTI